MNDNYIADFCYLLIDTPTNGILYNTSSCAAAQAIQLFSSNIYCTPLETHSMWAPKDYKETNFNDFGKHYTIVGKPGQRVVKELPAHVVNERFMRLRQEIKTRADYHLRLHDIARSVLVQAVEHQLIVDFGDTIIYEIQNCRPGEGYFTDGVRSYALISGISNHSAYNELKLHIDNLSHQRMRNMSIYLKFRNMLNQTPADPVQQKAVIMMALENFIKNAYV